MPIDISLLAIAIYFAGITFTIGLQIAGAISLSKIRKLSARTPGGVIVQKLTAIAARRRLTQPEVMELPNGRTPFVTGLLRKTIFVPAGWPGSQSESLITPVLEHEMAHIAGRDLEWFFVSRLACSILWCQPFAWLLNLEMQRAAEERCDQEVVLSGIPQGQYAKILVEIQERFQSTCPLGISAGIVVTKSSLAKRVKSLLSDDVPYRQALSGKTKGYVLASIFVCSGLSAALIAQPPLSTPYPHKDSPASSFTPQYEPADSPNIGFGPFKFKDGSSVKLEFLYQRVGNEIVAWRPNGKRITIDKGHLWKDQSGENSQSVRCLFQLRGVVKYNAMYGFKNANHLKTNAETIEHRSDLSAKYWAQLYRGRDGMATLQIGDLCGPYETWTKAPPLKELKPEDNPNAGKAYALEVPQELAAKDIKITGQDSQGKLVSSGYFWGRERSSKRLQTLHIRFAPGRDVRSYVMQYRDYQWIDFKGVHLTPDSK